MKKKNVLLFSAVLSLSLLGGKVATAATYTDALNATSNGTVVFGADNENEKGVPDPTNPDTPVMPDGTNPLNPSTADLRIMYVPDFDFGVAERKVSEVKQKVSAIKVKDIDPSTGSVGTTTREVVPFATTLDLRTARNGWTLSVTQGEFKQNTTHSLTTAYIQLKGLNYATGGTVNTAPVPSTLSTAAPYSLAPNTKANIAKADNNASAGQGLGKFSLAFGSNLQAVTDIGKTTPRQASDGAVFIKPNNQAVNEATYNATLTWELTPTVANLAN